MGGGFFSGTALTSWLHVNIREDLDIPLTTWVGILVQVTIYRRLLIGRDGHLDQSEAYDIS